MPDLNPVVVNLYYRVLGFVLAPGNPRRIRGFEDLAREDVSMINRQKGAGTRNLIDHHLGKLGMDPSSIRGYGTETYTHMEVGFRAVGGDGRGDRHRCRGAAPWPPLHPHHRGAVDMVLGERTFFERGVQVLLDVLTSRDFRQRVEKMGNYDFRDSGKIIHAPR